MGKGETAEVEKPPEFFRWVVREYLPDCHNFVEGYQGRVAYLLLLFTVGSL